MPILVHFKAKNNDNPYFYKNCGLSFPWVPYYLKLKSVSFSLIRLLGNVVKKVDTSYVDKYYATKPLVLLY